MDKSKIAYLILKNLYNGNVLSNQELGLNNSEYAQILCEMQNENLISGIMITNQHKEGGIVSIQNGKITVSGINYLMENTIPNREYKLKVSVDETLNGVEISTMIDVNGRICRNKKVFNKSLKDLDVEVESFLLAVEGLKNEKQEALNSCTD
ncbi:YjcQ family protein [Clostridium omnivorum]|uniref:Uncharacterized protein n=1 Tax=Clostridium omnivorum TaxID=1604902 RepID=A0ABQ5N1A4_9CLOT|nr:YjcQ family protein [Clostridium sp. E14]GLC28962.1 hypothetical protein bsdE14_03720 [Clostridium sp. E14]